MTTAYKVVHRETRRGSNFAMIAGNYPLRQIYYIAKKGGINLDKFFPAYLKDKRVRYIKGSAGIFCFSDENEAKLFKYNSMSLRQNAEIIQVEGFYKLDIKLKPFWWRMGINIQNLPYRFQEDLECAEPGIVAQRRYASLICFKSVLPLE